MNTAALKELSWSTAKYVFWVALITTSVVAFDMAVNPVMYK